MALIEKDYDTIKVNELYLAIIRKGSDDSVITTIEDGSELMEEENGGNEVLKYEEFNSYDCKHFYIYSVPEHNVYINSCKLKCSNIMTGCYHCAKFEKVGKDDNSK